MKVGVDNDVDGFRLEAVVRERVRGMYGPRDPHTLQRALVMPDAASGLDQNALPGTFDDKAVKTRFDTIQFIACLVLRPEGFGDDAEHSAAIPPVRTGADGGDSKVADFKD
jgi:hypothetical protein